jgi:hypothetical protein
LNYYSHKMSINIQIQVENIEDTAVIGSRRLNIANTRTKFYMQRPDSEELLCRNKVVVHPLLRSKTQEIQVNFRKFLTNLKCPCNPNQKMLCLADNKANCDHCG